MPDQQQPNQQQIQIKITDEILKGVYANFLQVMHTPEEFVLDFMNIFGASGAATSRVILSPGHMKRIITALQENMKLYEGANGVVKASDAPAPKIGFEA
jgi:hypothetical protein